MKKEENIGNQYLLFWKCFSKLSFTWLLKTVHSLTQQKLYQEKL